MICLTGFQTPQELDAHQGACSKKEPKLNFLSTASRHNFEVGKKKFPTTCILALDIESQKSKSEVSFGPMSVNKGKHSPISVGFSSKFLLHAESYPLSLPKVLFGTDCLERVFEELRWEVFYLQAIIQKNDRPMRALTNSEKELSSTANQCGNCTKLLTVETRSHNHCHSLMRCYTGELCKRCQALFVKNEALQCYVHNLAGKFIFDE